MMRVMTPNDLHATRAAYVRSLLAWHGRRQSDLAQILGCSQQNASQKLAGKRRFTTDDLLAIAEALDVDPRYLLTVPRYDRGLLTCTKYQLRLLGASAPARYGDPATFPVFGAARVA